VVPGVSTETVRNESEGFIRLVERCIKAEISDHRYLVRTKRREQEQALGGKDDGTKPNSAKPLKEPKKHKRCWVQEKGLFLEEFKQAVGAEGKILDTNGSWRRYVI
jgi:hypothetical protein